MGFINKMKKREFIEMGLKALAGLLAAFLAIILMEGMIYSIHLSGLKNKSTAYSRIGNSTIAYCIKDSDDKYTVLFFNEDPDTKGVDRKEWSATTGLTRQECVDLKNAELHAAPVKEVIFHAPNAFEFSITGTHYIVMTLFVLAVAGFFTYKFVALSKEYKKIEENFKKTGTIEL